MFCKSGQKPSDIPADPGTVYARAGWSGTGDWLGTGHIADQLRKYRPFKQARAFVHGFDLNSGTEWNEYCHSGKKPNDIQTKPNSTYANSGWSGMGDWRRLGRLIICHVAQPTKLRIAEREQVLHTLLAHVAERHRRPGGLLIVVGLPYVRWFLLVVINLSRTIAVRALLIRVIYPTTAIAMWTYLHSQYLSWSPLFPFETLPSVIGGLTGCFSLAEAPCAEGLSGRTGHRGWRLASR